MEIKEIVSYFVNSEINVLEVSFRTIDDNEDVLRNDVIDYSTVDEYGYQLESENFDFFADDDFEEDVDVESIELDKDELLSFLNEYYTVNGHLIPKPELY